jgi:hypothetical protein
MKKDKKYTEIMKQLNYKPIGSVLLRLYIVVCRFLKRYLVFKPLYWIVKKIDSGGVNGNIKYKWLHNFTYRVTKWSMF